jgi:protein Tex
MYAERIAGELSLAPAQVAAALALFDDGATVPFVARYRKEATGGLDEVQLRDVLERSEYLTELKSRRETILKSIDEQGKLDAALRARLMAAPTKQALEDLYLPYKPKRRTRATIAKERGLEPLADLMWSGTATDGQVEAAAASHVDPERGVPDVAAGLQGARDIIAERVAEDADVRTWVRDRTRAAGSVVSRARGRPGAKAAAAGTAAKAAAAGPSAKGVAVGGANAGARGAAPGAATSKFADYFDFSQKVTDLPSHRILAIRRGEAENELSWTIEAPVDELAAGVVRRASAGRAAVRQLAQAAEDAYRRLLAPSIEVELRLELKTRADEDAIGIFGSNLEQLLLGAPAGERVVLGLDPGYRTGVKAAVVSRTGALLATETLYLHQEDNFLRGVKRLVRQHDVELIAIGNGTASREAESLVKRAIAGMDATAADHVASADRAMSADRASGADRATSADRATPADHATARPQVLVVNESGASVYSASDIARDEFPDLDVSMRGAPSIARRLQDPLAELVKIDPKSIGVGQYQHDVSQTWLKKRLDDVVETCVNRVGVEVNTASAPLLAYVAGLGPTVAKNMIDLRDSRGGFRSRRELLDVPRLGAKAFEQAAGFLRVRGGTHPLDATAVHPERYALVERMAADLDVELTELVRNDAVIDRIELKRYASDDVGLPTLRDIVDELRRPGRDPRDTFELPAFREDVTEVKDLTPGMRLEGVVTNIVAFGAFVDVGVHQDGLVHVSQLADRFVKDPADVVKVGQKVSVTVVNVDLDRNRIGLSMKRDTASAQAAAGVAAGTGAKPCAQTSQGDIAPNGMRFS